MKLNELKDNQGARKERTRVGRGYGSGKGVTAGRGQKGQKSRSGVAIKGYVGGQMPIHMRLPKRGFNNPFPTVYAIVNIGRVQRAIDDGKLDASKPVNAQALLGAGLLRRKDKDVRLLAKGELKAKVAFELTSASKGAQEAVEKAGGSIKLVPAAKPAADKASA
mgnify:CR=1 FL=1